jgi:signal transduction histidine kinase
MRALAWRLVAGGLIVALALAASGGALERARFGATDDEALARVEAELRRQFDTSARTLTDLAAAVRADSNVIRAALRDRTETRRLFALVSSAVSRQQGLPAGITIYDAANGPLAWAGRVSDLAKQLVSGPPSLVMVPGALGPRLVRVEPVEDSGHHDLARDATIVVEQSMANLQQAPGLADTAVLSTSLVPATIRTPVTARGTGTARPPATGNYAFTIRAPSGTVLVDVEVARADLAAARADWRSKTTAASLIALVAALLIGVGPVLDLRRHPRSNARFLLATAIIPIMLLAARSVLLSAVASIAGPQPFDAPANLLLTALTAAGLVRLGIDALERRRIAKPRLPVRISGETSVLGDIRLAGFHIVAGMLTAAVLVAYERFLGRVVEHTDLDVLHFSLHPLSASRIAIGFALVLLHGAVIWGTAMLVQAIRIYWRTPRERRLRVVAALSWIAGAALAAGLLYLRVPSLPLGPLGIAIAASGGCAVVLTALPPRARRGSQTRQLVAVFAGFAVPAIAMYPSLLWYATASKEQLIATRYAPRAESQRNEIQQGLNEAHDQIDAMPNLVDFVRSTPTPTTDTALTVWRNTSLATSRLTSAIELYDADGALVSRFALNLPEYTTRRNVASSCEWEVFEEVLPFGASERDVTGASRGICDHDVIRGSIVVLVMLDYRTLPFMSPQNPYMELLRPDGGAAPEGSQGNDIEFVGYSWSRATVNGSGPSTWILPDEVFQRAVESRQPFWTTLLRDNTRFRVYLTNDRFGIYAMGYPVPTWFGHLVNLAELIVLVLVLYALLVVGAAIFSTIATTAPVDGRALLREFRSSFYRKLFLAFVAAVVVPVVALAYGVRTYFANQARAELEETAARTATVAQRLVEDYATLQQRGNSAIAPIDDQIMVLVSRAIDQDVNLFDGSSLEATSQRDLFASGLFSRRTPGTVYRQIVLERRPSFVGVEQLGNVPYRVASAPVRAGGRDGIVMVPLPLGQQQLDRQIDELDRQVIFWAVLFMLLGAGAGYFFSERIADPINRLSHATRRIARGDLDARTVATSADELGRLVGDFNRMADDLKRQRKELERTQRLEAWADMARQVAHDIKNPLTPIQLSAEHVQRINVDHGRPLSPVIDDCVHAILTQVTLLRQIASEFSSFASSPTARPEPTALYELFEEVVTSYRTGLAGRIRITIDAAPDLPAAFIDRTLFSRAVTNVIENALHAMPGTGQLTIRAALQDRSIVVEITDSGVGMDADALARIFEPYFSTKATGTGLGLTIAKRNIELAGGTIAVSSERGVGSMVTIRVPVASDNLQVTSRNSELKF